MSKPKVAVLIGSKSDEAAISESFKYLDFFGIEHELHVLSAHRNPKETAEFATNAEKNGFSASTPLNVSVGVNRTASRA